MEHVDRSGGTVGGGVKADRAWRAVREAKALVVRAPNWIGDAVMATPTLFALRAGCPDASITVLAKPLIAEALTHHPAVDEIMLDEIPGRHAGPSGRLRLAAEIRARRFDAALLLTNSFGSACVMALARVPCRIGYRTDGRSMWLTVPVPKPSRARVQHLTAYYLELLAPWHLVGCSTDVRLRVTEDERARAGRRLEEWGIGLDESIVGLNPGAAYGPAKRWPAERYAEVARRLALDGARVVLFGAVSERPLGDAIAAGLDPAPVNAMGRTTLREAMALLTWCRHLVTNDSGPMHLAAALGVPVTAIFGPTDPGVTGPVGEHAAVIRHPVDCAPCRYRECPIDHRCMTAVSAEEVYKSAISSSLIGKARKPRATHL